MVDPSRVLTLEEVVQVAAQLRRFAYFRGWHKEGLKSKTAALNLTIFRLSACCGLRCCEMGGLRLGDVVLTGPHPCIRIRARTTKGQRAVVAENGKVLKRDRRRARIVPADLDAAALRDLRDWAKVRWTMPHDGSPDSGRAYQESLFLAGVDRRNFGGRVSRDCLGRRWRVALACLGPDRRQQVSVHGGRRTFATLAHAAGYSIACIRDWLGHKSSVTTDIYLGAVRTMGLPDAFSARPEVVPVVEKAAAEAAAAPAEADAETPKRKYRSRKPRVLVSTAPFQPFSAAPSAS